MKKERPQNNKNMNEEELKKALFNEIEIKSHRIWEDQKYHLSKLQDLNLEKRRVREILDSLAIPIGEYYYVTQYIYSDENDADSDVLRLIDDAVEYVNREYDKSKEEGRSVSALFRSIFKLVNNEAYIKAMEKL